MCASPRIVVVVAPHHVITPCTYSPTNQPLSHRCRCCCVLCDVRAVLCCSCLLLLYNKPYMLLLEDHRERGVVHVLVDNDDGGCGTWVIHANHHTCCVMYTIYTPYALDCIQYMQHHTIHIIHNPSDVTRSSVYVCYLHERACVQVPCIFPPCCTGGGILYIFNLHHCPVHISM